MSNFINNLDNVLLSEDVKKSFYESYKNNEEFKFGINKVLPEISVCANQTQNTPWHIYNVLDHTLHSVSNMNKLSAEKSFNEKRLLAYTMLLHDIGKPSARKTVIRDGKQFDSFKGHNIESCKISYRALPDLGFKQNEIKQILELIEKHDIFSIVSDKNSVENYQIKLDDKFIKKLKEDMSKSGDGEKLCEFLGLVAKADNLAQNPEMISETLRIIEKYNKMLENQREQASSLGDE